jgi:hypothetical protein
VPEEKVRALLVGRPTQSRSRTRYEAAFQELLRSELVRLPYVVETTGAHRRRAACHYRCFNGFYRTCYRRWQQQSIRSSLPGWRRAELCRSAAALRGSLVNWVGRFLGKRIVFRTEQPWRFGAGRLNRASAGSVKVALTPTSRWHLAKQDLIDSSCGHAARDTESHSSFRWEEERRSANA